jgi:CheY-like chemotaxis protein
MVRIGVFESDLADQFLYKQALLNRNEPVEFAFFKSVNDASLAVGNGEVDILIIELHYLGSNMGLNILQRMKAIAPYEFTAIAVTSLLQEGDLERIFRGGFHACVEKPFIFEQLALHNFHNQARLQ